MIAMMCAYPRWRKSRLLLNIESVSSSFSSLTHSKSKMELRVHEKVSQREEIDH